MSREINISCDSVKVNGPLKDGSYTISFSTGEYEQKNIAQLMLVPQMIEIKLKVKYGEID